jgi:nitroreductase
LDALEALHTRNSTSRLTGTVRETALRNILRAGLRAPDHGQLRPWRILVIEGDGRERLGALFARAKLTSDSSQSSEQLAKLKDKPLRAPVVLIVVANIKDHPKIPEIEQVLSAGSVAQNMLIAAHALGLGAIWRTGEMTDNRWVKQGLGLDANDKIIGFIYVGEIDGRQKPLSELPIDDYVERWT